MNILHSDIYKEYPSICQYKHRYSSSGRVDGPLLETHGSQVNMPSTKGISSTKHEAVLPTNYCSSESLFTLTNWKKYFLAFGYSPR